MSRVKSVIFWGLGASFFFAEYFARVAPSVMAPDLMIAFQMSAAGLGALSAFFYYPYVLMQIPVGSLVDRFGPHRLLTWAAGICGLGCWLFAGAHQLWVADVGRFLVGFSASFAFVGTLKLATIWFDARHLGLLAGLTQGLGMLGAAVGASVFAVIVTALGWRVTMMLMAVILLLVALLIGLFVRDRYSHSLNLGSTFAPEKTSIRAGLSAVFHNRYSWVNALYAGLIYAPTAVFAELWGVSFLQSSYRVSHTTAAALVGAIFIGLAVGCPLIGWVSDRWGRRNPLLFISAACSLVLLTVVLYTHHLPTPVLFAVLFTYGLMNAGVSLSYAVAGELNPRAVAGVSIAFTNMASILLGGALLQPVVGWLLDLQWSGALDAQGSRYYSAANFHHALMILPVCLIIACISVFFIKETRCRGVDEVNGVRH